MVSLPVASDDLNFPQFEVSSNIAEVVYIWFSHVSAKQLGIIPVLHKTPLVPTEPGGCSLAKVSAIWSAEQEKAQRIHRFDDTPEQPFRGMVPMLHTVK
jgi:hypothetical protein